MQPGRPIAQSPDAATEIAAAHVIESSAGADPDGPAGDRARGGAARARGAALGTAVARPGRARVRAGVRAAGRRRARDRGLERNRRAAPGAAGGRGVGRRRGDHDSPFSFVASANVAVYERATPVFADIDPVTLNLDPAAAAAAVTERTRALLPVHVFGYPADMVALEALSCRSSRTPARHWARTTPMADRSAVAATRRCSASIRTSS